MIQYIPSQQSKKWSVSYKGDNFGNVINAFNLDLFSSQGKARNGTKIYPHTLESDISGITPPSSFISANISDSSTTPRKIWGVADSKKIIRSLASTLPIFTLDTATGFRSGEDTGSGSDLLTVKDDSGATIDADGNYVIGESGSDTDDRAIFGAAGTKEKQAQSFTGVSGPLDVINFDIKKVVATDVSDFLTVELQADSGGSPSGTALASSSINGTTFTTSFVTRGISMSDYQLDPDLTYWIVFGRSGSRDTANYYVMSTSQPGGVLPTGQLVKQSDSSVWSTQSGQLFHISLDIQFPIASERLYLSTNNDVRFLNVENGIWQSLWRGVCGQDALDTSYPHPMKLLGSGGLILLGDGNLLHSAIATATNSSDATSGRLVFPITHYITWIQATKSAVFIGLSDKASDTLPSIVCYYEPFSEVTRLFYIQEGATVGYIVDENCKIIDKTGQIRTFNGSEFKTTDYLPPYFTSQSITTLPHRNGIVTREGVTRILWEGQYPSGAGIWTSENSNLYHRNSLVFSKTTLNSYGTLDAVTGWRALYYTGAYHVVGASIKNSALATIKGVFSDFNVDASPVSANNRGNFVTSRFESSGVNSNWHRIFNKLDSRRVGADQTGSVKMKYRIEKSPIAEGSGADIFTGIWTSSTTFTCATTAFKTAVDASTIIADNEIIVRTGQGSGLLVHIVSITGAVGGTKTVTVDEGLAAISSGDFTFSVENWKKITNKDIVGKLSEWLQAKIEIRDNVDMEELQVGHTPNENVDEV